MLSMVTEQDMQRVAQLLSFEQSLEEIHARLIADGMSEEDFFLCYAAGKRLATTAVVCEHGVPKKFERHMSMSFFRPDSERCVQCAREEDAYEAKQEAELDAFLDRLRARKAQEQA